MKISLTEIASQRERHSRSSDWWKETQSKLGLELEDLFSGNDEVNLDLGGVVFSFPNVSFGAVSSRDLLGLDELILFSYYSKNNGSYGKVADLGANIGLHSLILASLGYQVVAYEPDPIHGKIAAKILSQGNMALDVNWVEKAVVPDNLETPTVEFVRVKGNTTSSHVLGAKPNPYGDLESFEVETESFFSVVEDSSLVKLDVEGLEAELLTSLSRENIAGTDFLVEVGSSKNAESIYAWSRDESVRLFSQKMNWGPVESLDSMPESYRDGSLFVSMKTSMPW
jgi:FkbM family methyltransferase